MNKRHEEMRVDRKFIRWRLAEHPLGDAPHLCNQLVSIRWRDVLDDGVTNTQIEFFVFDRYPFAIVDDDFYLVFRRFVDRCRFVIADIEYSYIPNQAFPKNASNHRGHIFYNFVSPETAQAELVLSCVGNKTIWDELRDATDACVALTLVVRGHSSRLV